MAKVEPPFEITGIIYTFGNLFFIIELGTFWKWPTKPILYYITQNPDLVLSRHDLISRNIEKLNMYIYKTKNLCAI